jgi:hypothetical protein
MRPEVARLLPPDAVTVASLDIQAVRDLPLVRGLAPGSWERYEEFLALTGFDPRRDLDRVTLASDAELGRRSEASLIVAEGRFGPEGAQGGIRDLFSAVDRYAGVTLYESGPPARGKPAIFAFLDERTAVSGSSSRVKEAIDRWQSSGELSAPARAALANGAADAWAATLQPGSALSPYVEMFPGGGGPLAAILDTMQTLSIRATALGDAIHTEMAFLCGGPEDARSLADAARTLAALGAMTMQRDRPRLAALIGGLQVGQSESETTVSIDLTQQQLLDLRDGGMGVSGVSLR